MSPQVLGLLMGSSAVWDGYRELRREQRFDLKLSTALVVFPPVYCAALKANVSSKWKLRIWMRREIPQRCISYFVDYLATKMPRPLREACSALKQALNILDEEALGGLDSMLVDIMPTVSKSALVEASTWGAMSTVISVLVASALGVLEQDTTSTESLARMTIYSAIDAVSVGSLDDELLEAAAVDRAVVATANVLAGIIKSNHFARASDLLRREFEPIARATDEVAGRDWRSFKLGSDIEADIEEARKRLRSRK